MLRRIAITTLVLLVTFTASDVFASTVPPTTQEVTLTDIFETLTLQAPYNTRVVVISVALLGIAAGVVGSFLLLRKRALMGDALSHATLPGVCIGFIIMYALGGNPKFLPVLLLGAAFTGLLGVALVNAIHKHTRLKEDAALGIVLSVFFALGMALVKIVSDLPGGGSAGIMSFIYGRTATMGMTDLLLIGGATALVLVLSAILFKEFSLLCFDSDYASSQGWPVGLLDGLMLLLVTIVTVVGLQAVGLILIIALLITPPAAARFWTNHVRKLTVVAAIIGAVSGWIGATLSALYDNLPAGAIIVLVAAGVFVFSMIFGSARGVIHRAIQHWLLSRSIQMQHLLRAFYEVNEQHKSTPRLVRPEQLLSMRSWSPLQLRRVLRRAQRAELISVDSQGNWQLTDEGRIEAARLVRNHRLWEMYLITHAEIAPSHVDRDADMIEHVLGPAMVARLEKLLNEKETSRIPASPHAL